MLTENFIVSKLRESTFTSEAEMLEYQEHDFSTVGDEDAFIICFIPVEGVVWVHYLWASDKRKMLKVTKALWAETQLRGQVILFDCDDYQRMFGNHARKIYQWVKEI